MIRGQAKKLDASQKATALVNLPRCRYVPGVMGFQSEGKGSNPLFGFLWSRSTSREAPRNQIKCNVTWSCASLLCDDAHRRGFGFGRRFAAKIDGQRLFFQHIGEEHFADAFQERERLQGQIFTFDLCRRDERTSDRIIGDFLFMLSKYS